MLTTEDLIKRYEANESTLAVIFNALRCSRKIGFRLCQYKVSMDLNEYYAALLHIPAYPDTSTGLIRTPVFLAFL